MTARDHGTIYRLGLAACLMAAGGCVSTDEMQSSMRKMTPSFMLSQQDQADRNLKNPVTLHLAYGQFEEKVGQTAEARKSYEAALRDDPQSVDAVLGLARLDQLADNAKDAEAGFQKALKMKPADARVLAACGQFYVSQKRWPEAFKTLNAAIAAAPHETFYQHELAVAKTISGDLNSGLAIFSQLIGPDKARYNVAFLLKQQGRFEAAAEQCRVALRINPNFEPAKTMLAQLAERQVAGDAHGTPGAGPAGGSGLSPRQAVPGSGGMNQASASASQAPSQVPAHPATTVLPVNGSDATFEPATQQRPY